MRAKNKVDRIKEFVIDGEEMQKIIIDGAEYPEFYITLPYFNNDVYKINDRLAFLDGDYFSIVSDHTFKVRGIKFQKEHHNYEILLETKEITQKEDARRFINNFRRAKGEPYLPLTKSELNKLLYTTVGHFVSGRVALEKYIDEVLQIDNYQMEELPENDVWGFKISCEAIDEPDFQFIYYYLKDAEGNLFINESCGMI